MNVNGFKVAGDDQVHKYRYPSLADIPNKNGSSIWTVEAENAHNGLIRISDLRGRTDLTPAKDDLVLDGNWNIYRIDVVGNSTVSATKFGNMGESESDSDIFRVSYEVTTGDEIHEAVSAGKVCILLYEFPGNVYFLTWFGFDTVIGPSGTVIEKSAVFTAIDGDEKTTIRVSGSTWFSPSTVKYARSASPTFTGTPKAPTAAAGTNTTQLATTAFVQQALASGDSGIFWATYNTTTEAEVTAAVTAGKTVLCKISDEVFYLVNKAAIGPSGSAWLFFSANSSGSQTTIRFTFVSDSYWNSLSSISIPRTASDIGAAPVVTEVTVSSAGSVTQALDPGKIYHFTGALTALTITLNAAPAGQLAQYHFDFDCGSTAPTVTLPSTVILPDSNSFDASTHYEVDILNNYGVVMAWATS